MLGSASKHGSELLPPYKLSTYGGAVGGADPFFSQTGGWRINNSSGRKNKSRSRGRQSRSRGRQSRSRTRRGRSRTRRGRSRTRRGRSRGQTGGWRINNSSGRKNKGKSRGRQSRSRTRQSRSRTRQSRSRGRPRRMIVRGGSSARSPVAGSELSEGIYSIWNKGVKTMNTFNGVQSPSSLNASPLSQPIGNK